MGAGIRSTSLAAVLTLTGWAPAGTVPECPGFGNADTYSIINSFDVSVVDLNGDEHPDLATPAFGLGFHLFRNAGDGTFTSQFVNLAGANANAITAHDLDGNGAHEVIITTHSANVVVVLTESPPGVYSISQTLGVGQTPDALRIADLNHDGRQDVVVNNIDSNDFSVLLNAGDGTLLPEARVPGNFHGRGFDTGDIEGDGDLDIVSTNHILRNDGNGNFAPPEVFTFTPTETLVLSDLDFDGHLDIARCRGDAVWVHLNDGSGVFQISDPGTDYPVGMIPRWIDARDIDEDGDTDLIAVNSQSQWISVLENDGAGVFGPEIRIDTDALPLPFGPYGLGVADFDGDGDFDIATTLPDDGVSDLCILFNLCTLFEDEVRYDAGIAPTAIAVTDVDRDGNIDLLTSNGASDDVSVLSGFGDGTFAPPSFFPVGRAPSDITFGDLDEDKWDDIVIANRDDNTISILANDLSGSFGPGTSMPVGLSPSGVITGDLDTDGNTDIVVSNAGSNDISVLLGTGLGLFASEVRYAAGQGPEGLALVDIDRDGALDIATADALGNTVSILGGVGDGTFGTPTAHPVGTTPFDVVAGDLDEDKWDDVVVVNFSSSDVSVLINNQDGTLAPQVRFGVGDAPARLSLGDLDLDGTIDISVSNSGGDNTSVLFGNGNGSFRSQNLYLTGQAPGGIALGDADNDGDLDLVTSNEASDDTSVLINTTIGPCAGDCDDDGTVGFNDLVSILFDLGNADPSEECDADGSGAIDFNDLVTALFAFGACP